MDDHSPRLICPATQPVLRNEWYVVAFSHEVDDRHPLLRYCCGDRIAFHLQDAQLLQSVLALR